MKQRELKNCMSCGRGVMHNGHPMFFRLSVEKFVVDLQAVQRQHGLEMAMGSPALAQIMGPDPDIAVKMDEHREQIVCFECASDLPLLVLATPDDDSSDDTAHDHE